MKLEHFAVLGLKLIIEKRKHLKYFERQSYLNKLKKFNSFFFLNFFAERSRFCVKIITAMIIKMSY